MDGGGGGEVDDGLAVFTGSTAAVADEVGGGGEGVDKVAWDAAKRCFIKLRGSSILPGQ